MLPSNCKIGYAPSTALKPNRTWLIDSRPGFKKQIKRELICYETYNLIIHRKTVQNLLIFSIFFLRNDVIYLFVCLDK